MTTNTYIGPIDLDLHQYGGDVYQANGTLIARLQGGGDVRTVIALDDKRSELGRVRYTGAKYDPWDASAYDHSERCYLPRGNHHSLEAAIIAILRSHRLTNLTTITATKGNPADTNTIWYGHVDRWTWIAMGAKPATVVRTEDGLMVDIFLGAGTRKRRLIVKLNSSDLYDIEIGRIHRRTLDWIVEAQTRDVYCDQLDQAIRDLYDAHKV